MPADAITKARRALARRVREPIREIDRLTKALATRDLDDTQLMLFGAQIERLREAHKVLRKST